jgi:hypothetical protein
MVTEAGQLKILDFGIARQARTAEGRELTPEATVTLMPTLAAPGTLVGTIGYFAPEMLAGAPADTRSDVFALGVTLYQLIAGTRPFAGESDAAVLAATLRDDPPRLTDARPDVPPALARIVERCLARQPEERYASAGEVAADLERLVAQTSRPESVRATRRLRLAVAALALTTLAVLVTVAWRQVREGQVQRARAAAVAEIERLADENRIVEAFQLAQNVPRLGPVDPILDRLLDRLSAPVQIASVPPGATVAYREYRAPGAAFEPLGHTPLEGVRVPIPLGLLVWRVERAGSSHASTTSATAIRRPPRISVRGVCSPR